MFKLISLALICSFCALAAQAQGLGQPRSTSMATYTERTEEDAQTVSMKKRRQAMEADTEAKALEMLEADRMKREQQRAQVLFGQPLSQIN